MITNGEKCHRLALETLSNLLQEITPNHSGHYFCMNWVYSFRTKIKVTFYENVYKDHDYGHIIISEEGKNIVNHNQDKKYLKTLFVIYVDTGLLLEKIHACDNNLEEFSTKK